MARTKIPDHELTEAQRKRRERNERYRNRNKVVNIETKKPEIRKPEVRKPAPKISEPIRTEKEASGWVGFTEAYKKPSCFFLCLSVLVITSLLITFQANAYENEGYGAISWYIAVICELSLVALTILYSASNSRLAGALFIYDRSYRQ